MLRGPGLIPTPDFSAVVGAGRVSAHGQDQRLCVSIHAAAHLYLSAWLFRAFAGFPGRTKNYLAACT